MRLTSSAAVLILFSLAGCGEPPAPPADDGVGTTPPDVPASPSPQRSPTLHVSPTGSDAGTCTAATPCRQIRRALQLATPGDTIGVANGSYLGFDVSNKNGTAAAPIAIVAPGRLAEITVTTDRSDNRDTIFITSSSYVELDGLRVFRANRVAVRISNSSHITVRNCVLGNNATLGILTGHSDDLVIEDNDVYGSVTSHGIYTANSGDRPTIRRNRVHDNAVNGIHMNGDQYEPPGDGIISGALVEANVIYNNGRNGGAGISMDGVQDSIVRNNLIYDNLGSGIRAYAEDGAAGPRGLQILHNTVHLPVVGGTGLSIRQSAGPNTLRNNILITRNPDRSGLKFGDRHDVEINAANSDYNVVERITPDDDETVYTLAQWRSQGYERNSVSASMASLWINPTNGDHHLAASSPAIDRGQTLAGVTRDIEGVTRPQGAASDIGAYERRP